VGYGEVQVHHKSRTFTYGPPLETATVYDGFGRVVQTTTPEGRTSGTRYNRLGQVVAVTTPELDGNGNGNMTDETLTGTGTQTPDMEFAYDDGGRLRFTRDPVRRGRGTVLYTTYDALGRPVDEGEVVAPVPATFFSSASYLNSRSWPTTGRSEQTTYLYDTVTPKLSTFGLTITHPIGRLVEVQFNSGQATGPNDGHAHYSYDADGRTTGYHLYLEGLGHKQVRYVFDRAGRPVRTNYQPGVSDGHSWATTYDTAGRVATQLGAAGATAHTTALPGGGYAVALNTYDARGRLTGTTVLGSVATAYGTDLRGRTTWLVLQHVGGSAATPASAAPRSPGLRQRTGSAAGDARLNFAASFCPNALCSPSSESRRTNARVGRSACLRWRSSRTARVQATVSKSSAPTSSSWVVIGVGVVGLEQLARAPDLERPVAAHEVDGVELLNPLEVDDVLEVPACQHVGVVDRGEGDVGSVAPEALGHGPGGEVGFGECLHLAVVGEADEGTFGEVEQHGLHVLGGVRHLLLRDGGDEPCRAAVADGSEEPGGVLGELSVEDASDDRRVEVDAQPVGGSGLKQHGLGGSRRSRDRC
jgi:YD repeat-containing protein